MERLTTRRPTGLDTNGLRKWGLSFVLMGIVSRALLQNGLLGMAEGTALMELFEANPDAMGIAAAAIVLMALESCAAPIFCFLLVERFMKEADRKGYILKLALVALITELPYNLAVGGELLALSDRNPVFGLVIAAIALNFYDQYSGKGFKNLAIKGLVTVCAMLWCAMLSVQDGQCLVLLTAVLWASREKHSLRMLFGVTASVICCLFSSYYLLAPMAFLAIHFYNGEEPEEQNELLRFWAYPAALAIAAAAMYFLF